MFGVGLGLGLGGGGAVISAPAFTPAARGASLKAWYPSGVQMQNAGGLITKWVDASGNGFDLPPGVTAPGYTASDASYGGQPVITCSGAQNALANAGFSIAQPDTIYVVGNISSPGGSSTFVDGSVARQFVGDLGAIDYDMWAGSDLASAVVPSATPRAIAAVFNGASSVFYVDSSAAGIAGNAGAQNLSGITVANGQSQALPNGSRIAEIVIVSGADSAAQVAQMFAYFAAKFGKTWA